MRDFRREGLVKKTLVRPERFELPTYCSGGNRSIHLSYGRTSFFQSTWVSENQSTQQAVRSASVDEGHKQLILFGWIGPKRCEQAKAHQRPRPALRPPRSPPRPRSRPPPPAWSPFGRASFTFSVRPPICVPFSALIAFSPSSLLVISTKPKPRERPVSRSVMMLTRSTDPNGSKI
jgi:hypothetical protein